MAEPILTSVTGDNENTTITCSGAMDLHNCREFGREIKKASESVDALTVDFRSVVFIDTAVVQDLLVAARTMMRRGKRLRVLVDESAYPRRVLKIIGCDSIMDVIAESSANLKQ